MDAFKLALRIAGIAVLAVAALHFVLGVQADVLLGAAVSDQSASDPTLNSQNRFYGTVFGLFGVLLIFAARNPLAHLAMLRCIFAVFFAGGIARLISILVDGTPELLVLALTGSELLLPPLLLLWLRRLETT